MKYKTIYDFMVEDEIVKGKLVYCLDKKDRTVFQVNDIPYMSALELLRDAKDNERYMFWAEDYE